LTTIAHLLPGARLARTFAVCLLLGLTFAAGADSAFAANTLTVSPGADPVQDQSMSIGISGATDASRSVYAYVYSGAFSCPSTAGINSGYTLTSYYGDFQSTGSFARSYSYTPSSTGTYTVCAYLATSSSAVPALTQSATFSVRQAVATVDITPGSDPTQDRSVSVAIGGHTEVSRTLYAYVYAGTPSCPTTAGANSGYALTSYYGDYQSTGDFSTVHSYLPDAIGTYTICAYVTKSAAAPPDGTGSATFTTRRPNADVALSVTGAPQQLHGSTVTVTGNTEVSRTLYVYASPAATCPATAAANSGSAVTSYYGDYQTAGAFTANLSWFPSTAGAQRLCAYVAKSSTATPDATAALPVTVAADPTLTIPTLPPYAYPDYLGGDSGGYGPAPAPASGVELIDPVDGAAGEQLNPAFRWKADPTYGADGDTLRIQRDEADGSTTKLVDFTSSEYIVYEGEDGEYDPTGTTGDISEIAKTSTANGVVTLQLLNILPPGRYSWFITRGAGGDAEAVLSARREFTVMGPHLRRLTASRTTHRGRTSKYPGSTDIKVRTTPYARVRFALRHRGRQSVYFFHTEGHGAATLPVTWSCSRPGGTYQVDITASDQFGATRHANVRFKPVSRARCGSMRRAEAAARRARERRRAAAQRAADRRAARAAAARVRRFKGNCRAIGGSPRTIRTPDGPEIICRSPLGGLLPVPGV
jgi:hypothetical protein